MRGQVLLLSPLRRELSNKPLQQSNATRTRSRRLMPRRRGLRPRLLAAVVRLNATWAFAAERQVVSRMPRFTPETEEILRAGGWTPARRDAAFADLCSTALDRFGGFAIHAAARSAIQEFGGLTFGAVGIGVDFARSDVVFDPRLAAGEEDRFREYFDELRGRSAYPLGECHHGHAFLAIDEAGGHIKLATRWISRPTPSTYCWNRSCSGGGSSPANRNADRIAG